MSLQKQISDDKMMDKFTDAEVPKKSWENKEGVCTTVHS